MTDAPTPTLQPTPTPAPTPAPSPTPSPAPTAEFVAPPKDHPLGAYWNAEKKAFDYEKSAADWSARDTAFTAAAERAKGLPDKPESYKAEPVMPEGVTLPEGAEIKFDPKSVAAASVVAHQLGIPQEGFSKLLGIVAAQQLTQAQDAIGEHQKMVAEEVKKLGGEEAAKARRAPIQAYASANFDKDEQAELNLILSTEAGTRALEKLIAKANGGSMPARLPGGDPPTPEPKSHGERIWPNGFSSTPQAKVG